MPRVQWGVSASDVDDFDRDSQFKPYAGPIPPGNVVYAWRIKVLKNVAGDRKKHPQLRVGLELVPRQGFNESKYAGYFVMDFIPIMSSTAFRYVPLLDALGVSGREFESNTINDKEGNIKKIGRWVNDGDDVIIAMLVDGQDQNGEPRKEIKGGTYGDLPDHIELSDSDDDDDVLPDDDELDADSITDEYEEEEEETPRRKKPGRKHGQTSQVRRNASNRRQRVKTAAGRRRRQAATEEYEEEDGF
jgi:hypothetical protein